MTRAKTMLRPAAWALAAAIILGACGGDDTAPAEAENPWAKVGASDDSGAQVSALNIGDVEQQVRIGVTLAEGASAANISTNVLEDASQKINFVGIEIAPPYPERLPLNVAIQSFEEFGGTPVVIRARYTMDAEFGDGDAPRRVEADLMEFVYGKDARSKRLNETINVLEAFETTPASILVQVEARALLMPAGTDEAALDPATAETTPDRTGVIKSNPVRIDFAPSEDAS